MTHSPIHPTRRQFAAMAASAAAALASVSNAQAQTGSPSPEGATSSPSMDAMTPLTCGLVLFPNLTAMDLVAPQLLMKTMMKTETHIVAQTRAPVMADSGFEIVPTMTFDECPQDLDVLFVPGGPRGTDLALRNDALLDFIADRGSRARYVTSVCTGSTILGAAGLLDGYRAASHWMTRDLLPLFGATPVDERVVIDRNRMTGGGITAGLDFGLVLSSVLRGEEVARLQQLILEYDPQPPFDSGSMRTAQPDTIATARQVSEAGRRAMRAAAEDARTRRSL